MTYDLRSGLAALGREERDVAPALPVDALTARAHRLRTTHAVQYSAIGVGAAAVLTLGAISADGLLLDRDPAPVPPATQTPTERPTQTPNTRPTPSATPTPTEQAFAPDWGMCGTEDVGDQIGEYDPVLYLSVDEWAVTPAGEPVPIEAVLASLEETGDVTARVVGAYAYEWQEEYLAVVVGVAAIPLEGETSGTLTTGGTGLPFPAISVPITSCDASPLAGGDGALDRWLDPAGWYVLALAVDVTTADGTTQRAMSPVAVFGTEPEWVEPEQSDPTDTWTIRETRPGGAEPVPLDSPVRRPMAEGFSHAVRPAYSDVEALCGTTSTPWPPTWLTTMGRANNWQEPPPAGVTNPFSVAATGFRDGGELIVRVTTTNSGPAVSDAWIASPGVTVVKDGRIIGWHHMWNWAYAPKTWGSGQTVQLELDLGALTCTFMNGEPWPAGTYEIYVQESMDLLPQAGYDERWRYGVVGGPFTFTLD